MLRPDLAAFFDRYASSVWSVTSDRATKACAIIDPVLDVAGNSGATATRHADRLLA